MDNNNNGKLRIEYLRLFTPILTTFVSILATVILMNLEDIKTMMKDIDCKVFAHLTNDEMHTPKSVVVTKAEFQLYHNMISGQFSDIRSDIQDIKKILERKK